MGKFRDQASEALKRAKFLLEDSSDSNQLYAALELRYCLEYLTYDRAAALKEDLPASAYQTWQPRKLLKLLLEIDSKVDSEIKLSIGIQSVAGSMAKEMHCLGTDRPLSLLTLKKHYDALGSFLHAPTLDQMETPKSQRDASLRRHCDTLIEEIERVLESSIWNITFGQVATAPCKRCEATVRCRMPSTDEPKKTFCFECNAPYLVTSINETSASFKPRETKTNCQNSDCATTFYIWNDRVAVGSTLSCPVCKTKHEIGYGISLKD